MYERPKSFFLVIIKESVKQLISDRYLLALVAATLVLATVASVTVGFLIRPSELQLVSHYSAFGLTHLYRDQWFYLLTFVAFELAVAVINSIVAIKIQSVKGRPLAILFAWFSIGIVIFGWIIALAVLNVWTPL
ncbi:hypothetical protein HGB25_02390 [Candidatus Saccharibacteria bacterium]|nr:hypothetical protein [Candidatus Saccharibacteria bacterium]